MTFRPYSYYEAEYSKGATPDLPSSRRQYAVVMKDVLQNLHIPNPPPSGLDFSCIPDAKARMKLIHASAMGSFEISSISIGVDVLYRHLYLFIWIFNEQLEARLAYNEAFYDESLVESILETIKEHLISSLQYQPSTLVWGSLRLNKYITLSFHRTFIISTLNTV